MDENHFDQNLVHAAKFHTAVKSFRWASKLEEKVPVSFFILQKEGKGTNVNRGWNDLLE